MIRMVVFDMDGVLCRYRIERRLALLASWSGQTPETIHAAIWGSGFEDEAERGLLSADDYLLGFGEHMHYPLSAVQWVEARRVAMEPDQAVLALARRLCRIYPVGMFTNNPWLLQRHIAEVFPAVPDLFGPRAVFSAELGRVNRNRRLSVAEWPVLSVRLRTCSTSMTMPAMWWAPGKLDCQPIRSAEPPPCAPASPAHGLYAGDSRRFSSVSVCGCRWLMRL